MEILRGHVEEKAKRVDETMIELSIALKTNENLKSFGEKSKVFPTGKQVHRVIKGMKN